MAERLEDFLSRRCFGGRMIDPHRQGPLEPGFFSKPEPRRADKADAPPDAKNTGDENGLLDRPDHGPGTAPDRIR